MKNFFYLPHIFRTIQRSREDLPRRRKRFVQHAVRYVHEINRRRNERARPQTQRYDKGMYV